MSEWGLDYDCITSCRGSAASTQLETKLWTDTASERGGGQCDHRGYVNSGSNEDNVLGGWGGLGWQGMLLTEPDF